jgi:predicted dehydrogenase
MSGKTRVVIVGCGGISGGWFKAVVGRPDVEVVGLVDIRPESAQKRAEEFQLEHAVVGEDLNKVLRKTSPDVLFNCTVPEAHAATTLAALKRGCHVLCEKPLADTMSNARRMLRAARQAGKLFAIMQNRRFDPNIRRARAFLDSGALGELTTVQSNFFVGAHFGGFRDHMEHVLILDMAIHTFDAARFLTGANPAAVYCQEWNPQGSWYDRDASAVAVFEMAGGKPNAKSNLIYMYQGSWCADGHPTTWEAQWRIIGKKGTLLWDGATGLSAQVVSKTGAFRSEVVDAPIPPAEASSEANGHAWLIHDFLDCLRTGRTPDTIATNNIHSLAMVHGAIASAKKGRKVPIILEKES